MHSASETSAHKPPLYRVTTLNARFFNVLEPAYTDSLRNARTQAHTRAVRHPQHRTLLIVNRARGAVLFDSAHA